MITKEKIAEAMRLYELFREEMAKHYAPTHCVACGRRIDVMDDIWAGGGSVYCSPECAPEGWEPMEYGDDGYLDSFPRRAATVDTDSIDGLTALAARENLH